MERTRTVAFQNTGKCHNTVTAGELVRCLLFFFRPVTFGDSFGRGSRLSTSPTIIPSVNISSSEVWSVDTAELNRNQFGRKKKGKLSFATSSFPSFYGEELKLNLKPFPRKKKLQLHCSSASVSVVSVMLMAIQWTRVAGNLVDLRQRPVF